MIARPIFLPLSAGLGHAGLPWVQIGRAIEAVQIDARPTDEPAANDEPYKEIA